MSNNNNRTPRRRSYTCSACGAECAPEDSQFIIVKGLLENGNAFTTTARVCWFCLLDAEAPLPVSACLVPQISTELQNTQEYTGPQNGQNDL